MYPNTQMEATKKSEMTSGRTHPSSNPSIFFFSLDRTLSLSLLVSFRRVWAQYIKHVSQEKRQLHYT